VIGRGNRGLSRRINARASGIATCIGLVEEARVFTRVLEAKGFAWHSVFVQGRVRWTDRHRIPDELKILRGSHEALCNPILQGAAAQRTED